MKNRKIRFLLFLLLCVFSQGVRADWTTVWSEDFNQATIPSLTDAGWNYVGSNSLATISANPDNSTQRLRVAYSNGASSATTPAFGTEGHLILTFDYARASGNYADFNIKVTGGGSFSEEQKSFTVNDESYHANATFNIIGATASTKITFETTFNSIYIDNIVVQAESSTPTPITVAAPTFSLAAGHYSESKSLTISCETEGASIYYTTDGTQPTNESTPYSGAITISESQTVKAIAYKGEMASDVASANYYVGTTLFVDDFAEEANGYKVLDTYSYVVDKQDVGRSAILTFRLWGRQASSSAEVSMIENYTDQLGTHTRNIYNLQEVTPAKNEWTTYTYAIPMQYDNSTLTLTITSDNCNLDDVILVTPPTITLDQNADNSSVLTANINNIVDVATVRTLRGGIWNTLCLPFDVNRVDLNTALGLNQDFVMTCYSSYADGVMTFSNVDAGTVIVAGTPFLLKCNRDCVNPTFRAVTIKTATAGAVPSGGVTFQGCFSPTELDTKGHDLFLGTDNYLYIPAVGTNTLGGLRAYIHLDTPGTRLAVAFDDEATGVGASLIDNGKWIIDNEVGAVYTLDGRKVVNSQLSTLN